LVNPVRNSSPAIAGLETERRIVSNGVKRDCIFSKLWYSDSEKMWMSDVQPVRPVRAKIKSRGQLTRPKKMGVMSPLEKRQTMQRLRK
jgi:hypothetical protein